MGYVTQIYVGYNITAIRKQPIGTTSLINNKMLCKSKSVIDSTNCINKTILYSGDNDVDHTNCILNSPDGQNIIHQNPIQHRLFPERSLSFQLA
jgi:hypothetical protein